MTNGKRWLAGVGATLTGAALGFLFLIWWGHFEATAQTARSAAETEQIQEKLVIIVDKLSDIHEAKDAGLAKVAELCRAGKLTDCNDCSEAGVELNKCMN